MMQDLGSESKNHLWLSLDNQTIVTNVPSMGSFTDLSEILGERLQSGVIKLCRVVHDQKYCPRICRSGLRHRATCVGRMAVHQLLVSHFITIHEPIEGPKIWGMRQFIRESATGMTNHFIGQCNQSFRTASVAQINSRKTPLPKSIRSNVLHALIPFAWTGDAPSRHAKVLRGKWASSKSEFDGQNYKIQTSIREGDNDRERRANGKISNLDS